MSSSSTAWRPRCRCSARWFAIRTSSTAITMSIGSSVSSRRAAWRNEVASRETATVEITPEVLLKAYACGIFPMAESAEDPALYWIEPEDRGILALDGLHVSSRLKRTVRSDVFRVVCNQDFEAVIDGCAEPRPGRNRTWINTR